MTFVPVLKDIPSKATDVSDWYQTACFKAELVSRMLVRSCFALRSFGCVLRERLQVELDVRFKAGGLKNTSFPLQILSAASQHAIFRILAFVTLSAALSSMFLPSVASASLIDARVNARTGGNRLDGAHKIARVIFAKVWPVQILKIRLDGVENHEIAGVLLEARDFHRALNWGDFSGEIEGVVSKIFAVRSVEEVDVWGVVPIPVAANAIVSGDYAVPTTRTVFSVTVRRADLAALGKRLVMGNGVYVESQWRRQTFGLMRSSSGDRARDAGGGTS
jgi:hypothetical protein